MFNIKSTGLAAAGALVGILAAGVASAQATQNGSDAPQLTVQFKSSLLGSDEGVHRLYSRLLVAAEKVCPQPVGLLVSDAIIECRKQAIQGAVAQIHNPRLAALSDKSSKRG